MSELNQAVATLAEYIASDNMDIPDTVKSAAGVYATACQKVNERLVTCDQLLRAGQRSEALRQAQLEPDVLKLYASLEFPGRASWEDAAGRIGLPVPQRLNAVVARRLNKAFAESQSTEDLLRQHRSLALARAPLQRRLDILRLLAKAEPNHLGWADDLRAYEAARFEEIRASVADSRRELTWESVNDLLSDITGGGWLTPAPVDLIGMVQDLHDRFRRAQGERVLAAINPRLSQAVADGNLTAAREFEARVVAVVKEFAVPEGSRLLGPYRQAAEWIDREIKWRKKKKQFDQAVDQLRSALADGVDWSYVQEYYQIALGFEPEMALPADVASEFAARASRRRLVLWLAVGAGVVGVSAIGVGALVYLIAF